MFDLEDASEFRFLHLRGSHRAVPPILVSLQQLSLLRLALSQVIVNVALQLLLEHLDLLLLFLPQNHDLSPDSVVDHPLCFFVLLCL